MNYKEPSFKPAECQEVLSLCEQFQAFSGEQESSTDNNQDILSYKNVPQTSSSHLVTSIHSRIKDYDDRIYKEQQAIKALRQINDDDRIRMKSLIQSNEKTEDIRLNTKYYDRIKTLCDRFRKSNLTIEKFLATLKLKVKAKEKESVMLGGQLKCHLDGIKQKWEADYQKYNSKPHVQQMMTLRKSLNELGQIHTFKEQQADKLKLKLHEIENYKGYGFKSYQEIVVKMAQIKVETMKTENEIDDIREQIRNVDKMQIDEVEAEVIPEKQAEVNVMEALVCCNDGNTTSVEGDTADINVWAPKNSEIAYSSNQDISMVNMEEEPSASSQTSLKSLPNSQREIWPDALPAPASTLAIFTPPNTQTTVSSTCLISYPEAALPVSQANCFAPTNLQQTPAVPRNLANPTITAIQSNSSFSFAPPTPKTPKGQTTISGFSLDSTFLTPTTGFNLGLSNPDSTFSGIQKFSNREIPDATAEKSGSLHPSESGSKNARCYEGSAFLFQPTTPKPQQSTSFFGMKTQPVPSDSFNFQSFSSTPQETSKYFSNDFPNAQEPQGGVSFALSIFGGATQGTAEASGNGAMNQGSSFFNF